MIVCACVLPARTVEEQLSELTRLVLRLPEVDSLLQKAGSPPKSTSTRLETTSALEMFVKVTHAHGYQHTAAPATSSFYRV